MSFWQTVFGCENTIRSSKDGFRWLTAGLATKYLLVWCDGNQPAVALFSTSRDSRSSLLNALDSLRTSGKECLLLGIETAEVSCTFYKLDLDEARQRLAVDN